MINITNLKNRTAIELPANVFPSFSSENTGESSTTRALEIRELGFVSVPITTWLSSGRLNRITPLEKPTTSVFLVKKW